MSRSLTTSLLAAAAALTVSTAGIAAPAKPMAMPMGGIVRDTGPTPGLILRGVVVPASAELFMLSGQLASPIDPTKKMGPDMTMADFGDTKTQTISVFNKIKGLLAEHGYTMADVIKLTVFVAGDPKLGGKMDFAGMNEGYKMFFGTAENPNVVARSTIQVAALAGPTFLVEIEATAAKTK